MKRHAKRYLRRGFLCAAALGFCLAQTAPAGPLGLPIGPILRDTVGTVRDTVGKVTNTITNTVDETVAAVQLDPAGRPIDPALFERDENGARIAQGIILAISLSDRGKDAAEGLDVEVGESEDFDALDLELTKLKLPPGLSATSAIKALRAADPKGTYDFDHIYDPSGEGAAATSARSAPSIVPRDAIAIGMIDSGIDRSHPAFEDADIVVKNTATTKSKTPPTEHGTAVASLLVGEDRDFHGALVGATLYAADVFGGSPTGGAADDIARGIAWLVDKEVPVINISVTGPKNALLEAAVRAALSRGHVIVAAVGNDGPAVGVKYPAAYDGVVAVTSVDARRHVQIDANRGPAVAFAARGVEVRAAQLSGKYGVMTGTSFASPIVAARFAAFVEKPDMSLAASAQRALIAAARSPANPERDPVYGYGVLDAGVTGELTAAH